MISPNPPRWADRFLQWYCRPDRLEEIQGDAWEIFRREVERHPLRAKAGFIWNVLRFFRWKNIRRGKSGKHYRSNSTDMFTSYLLTGYRSMIRNLVSSTINVAGLSVAIGCGVLIFILLDSYYDLDSMHEKGDRIWLVTNHIKNGDETQTWANAPAPLAEALKANAAAEAVTRVQRERGAVRVGDRVFQERLWFVDPDFMKIFSFRVEEGNRHALQDRNQLILSREMAIKYFGTEDPVGQELSIKFSEEKKHEFTVGAVMQDTPANSSMYFDFLLSLDLVKEIYGTRQDDWSAFRNVTFVMLRPGASAEQLNPTLKSILETYQANQHGLAVTRLELIPLPDVATRSFMIQGSLSWSNAPAAMVAFGVVATFLILLACFNYMNVAVASVSTRLKEIGIRKVIGGSKTEIIQQFLVENILTCLVALIVGTMLAYFIFVPGFDALYPVKIAFAFSSWRTILLFFGGLLLAVALISGAYPAFYIASFNPVKILRGKEKFGNKSMLSRILLAGQFTLSVVTIICCLVFIWADYYFERMDWGYDHGSQLVVPVVTPAQFAALRDKATQNSHITSVAGAASHVGYSNLTTSIRVDGENFSVAHLPVGENYLETMGMRIHSGRTFSASMPTDFQTAVVVNASFAKKMGWKEPWEGHRIEIDSLPHEVIGVVEDFHYTDFYASVNPLMFTMTTPEKFHYLVAATNAGNIHETLAELETAWHDVAPDDPWRGFIQDDVFKSFFDGNRANNTVGFFISGVALLLACMGLYGLVAYNLTRRLKEFSIRKVFGARLSDIFRLMNRDYLAILIIAFLLGAPVGSYLINMVIKAAYPDPIPVDWSPYIITMGMLTLTVALTLATQLSRVKRENPIATLRNE